MENKEKVAKIIYKTLEILIRNIKIKEDLDVLTYALEDYEQEGYLIERFREKYRDKIENLKDMYYNKK